jgi:hypothetical protein
VDLKEAFNKLLELNSFYSECFGLAEEDNYIYFQCYIGDCDPDAAYDEAVDIREYIRDILKKDPIFNNMEIVDPGNDHDTVWFELRYKVY